MHLNNITQTFLLCLITFFHLSCNEDETPSVSNTQLFTIETDLGFNNYTGFILVTDQDGNILYESVDEEWDETIELETNPNDIIDLTWGSESETSFRIQTLRDIQSGFHLGPVYRSCDDAFETGTHYPLQNVELRLEGLTQYSELIIPFANKEIEQESDAIIISGVLTNQNDILFTVLPVGSDEYRSITLNYSDWLTENEEIYTRTINIADFVTPEVHEIQLPEENNWIVNADILKLSGKIETISKWSSYNDYQNGNTIKLFLLPGTLFEEIRLEVNSGYKLTGSKYLKVGNSIPASISFPEMEINFQEATNNQINCSNNSVFDLAIFEYQYLNDNIISHWKIYQKSNLSLNYQLPSLPQEFLDQALILNNKLNTPENLIGNFYQTNNDLLMDKFHDPGIQYRLKCYDYEAIYDHFEF